jgi:hypothetical protein
MVIMTGIRMAMKKEVEMDWTCSLTSIMADVSICLGYQSFALLHKLGSIRHHLAFVQ